MRESFVKFRARCNHRRGGFTLMEVIMAIMIFVMLAAAVFGIMAAALQASSSLEDSRNRQEKLEALQTFLEHQLRSLTAQDTLVSYLRGDGEGLQLNGILWGNGSLACVLDAKVQPNGYYLLRFAQVSKANLDVNNAAAQTNPVPYLVQAVQSDDSTVNWTSLIGDVRTVSWRFEGIQQTQWMTDWNGGSPSNKPGVVEFSLQLAGEDQPIVMDFCVSNIQPAPASTPGLVPAPAAPQP